MGSAIADLIPLAIGIAVNPIPIMVVVLLLRSPGARANGLTFLGSWLLGLTFLATVALVTTAAVESIAADRGKTFEAVVKVLLGLLLLILAARKWGKRPQSKDEIDLPKWLTTIETLSQGKTLGLGLFISIINPKHIALTVAAMIAIAEADVATGTAIALLILFIALSSTGVGVPVIYSLVGGEQAQARLGAWKEWLSANNAAILAVLFLVFGVVLLSKGLGDLIG